MDKFVDLVEKLNDEFEDVGMFLDFVDDDASPEYVRRRVDKALEEYSLEEILTENEMDEAEALGILFEHGYVGLPEYIEDEEMESGEEAEDS